MKTKLYTVGYEGQDVQHFVAELKKKKIQVVADLRKNPLSRKPGFSKNRLAENLQKVGIDYLHRSQLGVPSEWRRQNKNGDLERKDMFERYEKKILPESKDEIDELRQLMKDKRLALLCYEADASDCHRRSVSNLIRRREKASAKNEVEVVDLLIPAPSKSFRGG